MSAIQVILTVILMLVSVVMMVSVLLQKGDAEGISALSGSSTTDNYLGKNQTKTAEGRLALITKASAIAFVALAFVMLFVK